MDSPHRCSICGKVFDLETSYNRHSEYCRRRAAQRLAPRPKACQSCRKTKTKCDFKQPCARCALRSTPCSYGNHGVTSMGQPAHPNTTETSDFMFADSLNVDPDIHTITSVASLEEPGSYSTFCNNQDIEAYINYNATRTEWDTAGDSLDYSAQDSLNKESLTGEEYSSLISYQGTDVSLVSTLHPLELIGHRPLSEDGNMQPFMTNVTVNTHTPGQTFPSSGSRQLVTSIARTYPRMMTQPNNLPPFVHFLSCGLNYERQSLELFPSTVGSVLGSHNPLGACVDLSHLFISRGFNSTDLVWRAIEMEQKKIDDELETFSQQDTIGASQAMIMYTIMRLSDMGREYFSFKGDMLKTMKKLGDRFEQLSPGSFSPPAEMPMPPPSWEDWVLEETRRRMSIICFLLSIVIGTERCGAIMNAHRLYLPSKKTLWEARTEEEWRREYESTWSDLRVRGLEGRGRINTIGDLMMARTDSVLGLGLDSWYSGLDGLGIMLAAVMMDV